MTSEVPNRKWSGSILTTQEPTQGQWLQTTTATIVTQAYTNTLNTQNNQRPEVAYKLAHGAVVTATDCSFCYLTNPMFICLQNLKTLYVAPCTAYAIYCCTNTLSEYNSPEYNSCLSAPEKQKHDRNVLYNNYKWRCGSDNRQLLTPKYACVHCWMYQLDVHGTSDVPLETNQKSTLNGRW